MLSFPTLRLRTVATCLAVVFGLLASTGASPTAAAGASEGNGLFGVFVTSFDPQTGQQSIRSLYQTDLQSRVNTYFTTEGGICKLLMAQLTKPDAISHGVSFHNDAKCASPQLGPTVSTSSTGPTTLHLDGVLPGIAINGDVTTPTVFGSGADPCVSLKFDLAIASDIALSNTGFDVGPVHASVRNLSKITTCNAAGGIEAALDSVYAMFGGTDFITKAQNAIDGYQTTLKLADALNATQKQMTAALTGLPAAPSLVNLNGNVAYVIATPQAPNEWNASFKGILVDEQKMPCDQFVLQITYEAASAMVYDPFAAKPSFHAPPMTTTRIPLSYGPLALQKSPNFDLSHVGCTFTTNGLPRGYFVRLDVTSLKDPNVPHGPFQWNGAEIAAASTSGDFIVGTLPPSNRGIAGQGSGSSCTSTALGCKPKNVILKQ
jgi:hypothetical protein